MEKDMGETACELHPGIDLYLLEWKEKQAVFHHEGRAGVLEIHHCQRGPGSWKTKDGEEIYLGPGDYCIHTGDMCSKSVVAFPQEYYRGITICIDLKQLTECPPELLRGTGITGEQLFRKFCGPQKRSVFPGNEKTDAVFSGFYDQPERLQLSYRKLKALELILYLSSMPESQDQLQTEYQAEQIEIIRQIHAHLTENLAKRVTIEDLSRQYLMNPTTLKTLFKAVYGTSVAAHIKEHRMEQAAVLLLETDDSIAGIARSVGYESQSKFTAAFKETYQMLPTEYRRRHSR